MSNSKADEETSLLPPDNDIAIAEYTGDNGMDGGSPAETGASRDNRGDDHADLDADDDANEEIQDYRGFAALVGGGGGKKQKAGNSDSTAPPPTTTTTRRQQISSQSIRRGEKDFEEHGTRAQRDALEQSRAVMESVLAYTRVHGSGGGGGSASADTVRGWYFPDVWVGEPSKEPQTGLDTSARRFAHTRHRVVMVEAARGTMFASVGAVPGRPPYDKSRPKDEQTPPKPGFDRVWLLPEEALFLVERGSMELWYPLRSIEGILGGGGGEVPPAADEDDPEDDGLPLSLEAAYSLLIGPDGDDDNDASRGRISLPCYQVYTHLRRSGYQVLRAVHTDPQEPLADAATATTSASTGHAAPVTNLWQWLASLVSLGPVASARPVASAGSVASTGPLLKPGIYRSYEPIYAQLRLARPPLPPPSSSPSSSPSPFRIVFHVWKAGQKGGVPFSKARPPPPDFYMAVADAHLTGVPTLEQIIALLASVPPLAPPAAPKTSKTHKTPKTSPSSFPPLPVIYRRLKLGRRCVIVSVVDHGIVNYMRFADGTFDAEPLYPRFDDVASGKFAGRGGGGKHGKAKGGAAKKSAKA